MYLLFPGRHHLLTNFQLEYLTRVTSGDGTLVDARGTRFEPESPVEAIVWAVTSANHANTRRNPLAGHRREAAIEGFAEQLDVPSYVYLIDDIGTSDRFAEYVLKKIAVDSQGRFTLEPHNTVVGCSTPELITMYERLGFLVLPVELCDREEPSFAADPPWRILDRIVADGLEDVDWRTHRDFLGKAARASRKIYLKYRFGDRLLDLHRSPLLTDDGDLTETRDYNVYVRAFDEGAERKYRLVRDDLVPGRIVDVGCCTGAVLREMSFDDRLRESDLYGIEVTRQLYTECLHRKAQGAFGNDNVFFYQQDFAAEPLFPDDSIHTFTTFSLTHEIESYGGRESLRKFIGLLHRQLASGGRWLNVDVVGPEDADREILMWVDRDDGRDEGEADDLPVAPQSGEREALRDYLAGLSTWGRFQRFARDFRGGGVRFREVTRGGTPYVQLTLRDACEFLSKKDYLDNWASEMHETFCFWSFSEWLAAAREAGFHVRSSSRAFANRWIVENRYRGKCSLWKESGDELAPLEYPVTNLVLVAEKRDDGVPGEP